jgi:hypothetical protein
VIARLGATRDEFEADLEHCVTILVERAAVQRERLRLTLGGAACRTTRCGGVQPYTGSAMHVRG